MVFQGTNEQHIIDYLKPEHIARIALQMISECTEARVLSNSSMLYQEAPTKASREIYLHQQPYET